MIKFKIFSNIKSEENWINTMYQSGYMLCAYDENYCLYRFKKIDINESEIDFKSDYRYLNSSEVKEYESLFSDFGWIPIKHNRNNLKHIFYRQKDIVNQELIFNEIDNIENQMQVLKRKKILMMLVCYVTLFLSCFAKLYFLQGRSMYINFIFDFIISIFFVFSIFNTMIFILFNKNKAIN